MGRNALPRPLTAALGVLLIVALVAGIAGAARPQADPWRQDSGLPGYAIPTGVAVGPDGVVYVTGYREGAVASLQTGGSWNIAGAIAPFAAYGVAADPTRRGVAIVATSGGLFRTVDAGMSWTLVGPAEPYYAITIDAAGDYWAGGAGTLLRSSDGGERWSPVATLDAVSLHGIATRPGGDLFVATNSAGIWRVSRDGHVQQSLSGGAAYSAIAQTAAGRLLARSERGLVSAGPAGAWTETPLPGQAAVTALTATTDAHVVADETGGVYLTRDGSAWSRAAPDLPAAAYALFWGDTPWAITTHRAYVLEDGAWRDRGSPFPRPLVRGLAWEGSRLLAATSDGVYSWNNGTWQDGALQDVLALTVLPHRGRLFAGTWNRGVVRSDDGGRTWHTVTTAEYSRANIPRLVAAGDKLVARVEYARTLVSMDGGDTWRLRDEGLTGRTVFSLASDGSTVWAGTDQGVFRLDAGRWTALPPGPPDVVATLAAADRGVIAGTSDGLWRATPAGWERDGLAGRSIVALAPGPDGRGLLAATSNDGVWMRRENDWIAIGLRDERVNDVVLAGEEIVAATESGVFRRGIPGE